ncbi:MAG TPA: hypothetical protein VH478_01285 [Trebonia sp.]|jgi:hypothetical protein|nr:hypothetical protein [Trebonia sp.]
MKWRRARWLGLEPWNPRDILRELAEELLGQQGPADSPASQGARQDARSAIRSPARCNEFLASAQASGDKVDGARAAAARELARPELAGWGVAGALAAFGALSLGHPAGPAGLAPVLALALAIALAALVARRLWFRHRHRSLVTAAERHWRSVLRDQVLAPFLVKQENLRAGERLGLTLPSAAISAASYGRDPELAVPSAAMRSVAVTARAIASGSIGVSGPRGAGKSTILNKFDTRDDPRKPEQDIRINIAAPVDYNAREFIMHLFSELCVKVQAEAPPLSPMALESRRQLNALGFLNTYSSSGGATLSPKAFISVTGTVGRERTEQPPGLPAIVARFRAFGERAADWNQSRENRAEGRLIICIDEMDKIRDSDRAEQFLNDIKAIFDVPGCLYLVSISEDAMTVFASRTPAIRTAFDSALDEIISVAPMTFTEAQDLLDLRVTGVPRPFLALCQVLAGGLPRDLIRVARSLIHVAGELDGAAPDLPRVARGLVKVRCEVIRREAILQLSRSGAPEGILLPLHRAHWPAAGPGDLAPRDLEKAAAELGDAAAAASNEEHVTMCQDVAVALSFYATVIEVFGERPGDVAAAIKGGRYPLIDDLAVARHAMRMNSDLARALLARYRTGYRAGQGHGGR